MLYFCEPFPLSCQASFFLSFALQLLSLVMSCGVTHVPTISLSLSQCCHQCPLFFCKLQYIIIGFVLCPRYFIDFFYELHII